MNSKSPSPSRTSLSAAGLRIGIVVSRFNLPITSKLLDGALSCLRENGMGKVSPTVVWVPGAFEIPFAADLLARTGRYDAIVCLGAVIRGETPHFDYVAGECARGIQEVMLRRMCPLAFGVLTTNTLRQAKARAGGSAGNKGWDAALSAIEMAHLSRDGTKL